MPPQAARTAGDSRGALWLLGDRATSFADNTETWSRASGGTLTTSYLPPLFESSKRIRAFRSLSGMSAITFASAGKCRAVASDGVTFGAPVDVPCGIPWDVRAAGDGHLWSLAGGNLYEQVGPSFENRGGPPAFGSNWDVASNGDVIFVGSDHGIMSERLNVWRLARSAGGWTKTGSVDGSVPLGESLATITNNGTVHVFSHPTAVEGPKPRRLAYLRSSDGGRSWQNEGINPEVLFLRQSAWRVAAAFATDDGQAKVIYVGASHYTPGEVPELGYRLATRCRNASGQSAWVLTAQGSVLGWDERGPLGFSETGVATFIGWGGLVQVR